MDKHYDNLEIFTLLYWREGFVQALQSVLNIPGYGLVYNSGKKWNYNIVMSLNKL